MSDTYSYEVLEPGGHARLVGNVLDRISEASANPASAVGSSRAILGDPETASWMERTTAADGAAVVEIVKGNTLRWNQMVDGRELSETTNGITVSTISKGKYKATGTSVNAATNIWFMGGWLNTTPVLTLKSGRKYIMRDCVALTSEADGRRTIIVDINSTVYVTPSSDYEFTAVRFPRVNANTTYDTTVCPQVFDLTQMFGAGNEPATVEEFEALFPEPYYPYDPGSLLPVRMEGIETTGDGWTSQRAIPASTYFPDGMRSAGTVRDELTETQAITRVGERAYQSGDESDPTVVTDGTTTHYALATPTTTPIDPPLPLSYRTGAGGTERVMVASGTTSAPPIFVTRYPLDPADLAASIAPVDGPTAKTNHAVGELVMLGFTLCKVTTAIARGEAITIGTNVTQTSVAAEIAALS